MLQVDKDGPIQSNPGCSAVNPRRGGARKSFTSSSSCGARLDVFCNDLLRVELELAQAFRVGTDHVALEPVEERHADAGACSSVEVVDEIGKIKRKLELKRLLD